MKVLLHIGYHKTASTFFQQIIFRKHPEFFLLPRQEACRLILAVGSFQFDPNAVREWFQQHIAKAPSTAQWAVLSEEDFSGNVHTGGGGGYVSPETARRLHRVFPEATVLILIRNQIAMIDSTYRHYVKRGGTFSLRKFLYDYTGMAHRCPQFCFEHLEYTHLIKYYQSLFGEKRVWVYPYESMVVNRNDFLKNLFERLEVKACEDVLKLSDKNVNPSYSRLTLTLARFTNHFYGEEPLNRRVWFHIPGFYDSLRNFYQWIDHHAWVKRWDKSKPLIPQKTLRKITRHYATDNQELARMLNLDLKALGYPIGEKDQFIT